MEPLWTNAIDAFIALVFALIAIWQGIDARKAKKMTTTVIAALNPADATVTTAPEILPGRTWKMTDETKHWLTFDHPENEQKMLLDQVAAAELNRILDYTIHFPGGYYNISSGLIAGSGRG